MLRTTTSLGAKGSGRRTVNVTCARGRSVGVGPLGMLVFAGARVGKVGHLRSEMAQAWLARAKVRIKKRMRREKTEGAFMVSPHIVPCSYGNASHDDVHSRFPCGTSIVLTSVPSNRSFHL